MTRRASILPNAEFLGLLDYVKEHSLFPERDRATLKLSFRAGLRAAEIGALRWRDAFTPTGRFGKYLQVPGVKKSRGRSIVLHEDLRGALEALWLRERPAGPDAPIIATRRDDKPCTPNNIALGLWRLYQSAGLIGCSSHSGRRTFLTALGRQASQHGCSIKDVQIAAGHRYLESTEAYLEPSENLSSLILSL